ncbi:hypothetical protein QFC22_000671 [Naganishia vaughanmartiniae]|uniref:Uncharacterized protein n=1 Tax=Naganishia vaughanmartiniae TaxID=1424756 RepID=A0ACC2XJ77_9TREE|nr:hypothetical protein QFC22_000671 [Naganishia vaughanmartiniae]
MMTPTPTSIRTPLGARYMTPSISSGYSPSSEVSLSRASSITIVQSPSTALANITRKAGRLLVPDEEDDDEHDRRGFNGAVVGKGDGGAEVARLRVDIASRQWLVGYGRYAKVYLGSFKPALRPPPATTTSTAKTPKMTEANMMFAQTSTGWSLCAAKVFDSDTESISMAEKEFAMLGYLQEDLPSTQSRPPMSVREGGEVNWDGDADGRRYILSRIGLVDETIIEPPPLSFTTGTPSDLSRSGSRRVSGAVASTCMVCESPVSGLPNSRTTVPLEDTFDTSPSGSHARTVYAAHRRGQASGPRHSRSASETTAILRQLGKNAIAAKSSMNAFLFAGGGTDSAPSYRPILLLPFYSNGSMATFLKTREEPIGDELWMSWFEQGLRALRWCKMKGVLHNDIKPANFLLDDEMNLRLGDTGSAMRINPDHSPHDGIGLGTVSYSSPEIVDPSTERTFSFPSDIFSFGVTMRQCMTGREPYEGLRTVELMYHVRKGNYWEWHARRDMDLPSPSSANSNRNPTSPTAVTHHLARVRATTTTATSPSDRNHSAAQPNDGVRRAESLREPSRNRAVVRRPALARTPSSDVVIRQAIPVRASTGAATGVVEAGGDGMTSRDQRETWLRRMVDPDPGQRPEAEDLLHGLEGHRTVYKSDAD